MVRIHWQHHRELNPADSGLSKRRGSMKLANPFYYPLAIFAGSVFLVASARVLYLPPIAALPLSAAIAIAGATWIKAREANAPNFASTTVGRDFGQLQAQAKQLVSKADELRQEATHLLTGANQLDQLASIQYACDRIHELPTHLTKLAERLQGQSALLSVDDLRQQLKRAEKRLKDSDPAARDQLNRLAKSLRRNIELAEQGTDTREAQLVSLSTLIQDAGGNLQLLQNKLRTADLSELQNDPELQILSQELSQFQDNMDLLLS
jgi:chromosome segregation ATPase